jgi:predicted DNA-binding WGR domain protein
MSWYDRYKEEKILINTSSTDGTEHNKFWAASWDETTGKVSVRWGRVGTKGQSKTHDKSGAYEAANFIEGKLREKRRKGYKETYQGKPITQAVLDRLNTEAAIVGTQNKCHDFKWVELSPTATGIDFHEISEDRLYDPACNPGILVVFETRKEYDNRTRFTFLFTLEETYDVRDAKRAADNQKVKTDHPLRKMVDKVEEAIGRSLATS